MLRGTEERSLLLRAASRGDVGIFGGGGIEMAGAVLGRAGLDGGFSGTSSGGDIAAIAGGCGSCLIRGGSRLVVVGFEG